MYKKSAEFKRREQLNIPHTPSFESARGAYSEFINARRRRSFDDSPVLNGERGGGLKGATYQMVHFRSCNFQPLCMMPLQSTVSRFFSFPFDRILVHKKIPIWRKPYNRCFLPVASDQFSTKKSKKRASSPRCRLP